MTLIDQVKTKASYLIHKATYDPEAEAYVKNKEDEMKKAAQLKEEAKKKESQDKEKAQKEAEAEQAKLLLKQKQEEDAKFSTGRLLGRIGNTILSIVLAFAIVGIGILGASLATNLNLHRELPYRLFYAVYGFIFSPLVILYCYGYRMFFLGKRPRFYALLPMIPYHIDNHYMQLLFSWLSYRPDDLIQCLEEWK
jgi:hypothetical protein